ncbi:MAG TPA: hypothetical protein PLO23_08180 [Alphaproteobacteria bacterium]|nr:hypothetical protein [Alphaproteobacteria bacterium]
MVSFASVLDEEEERRRRFLGTQFSSARGNVYGFGQDQTEDQQNAAAAGKVDTLDLTPQSKEKIVMQMIQDALDMGDTTYAADMMKYALQVPELDFTPHMGTMEQLAADIEAALPPDQRPSFADSLNPAAPTPDSPHQWLEDHKKKKKDEPPEATEESDIFTPLALETMAVPVFSIFG